MSRNQESLHDDERSLKIWDCGSPLYDAYELVAVSHVVERHFMSLPYLSGSRDLVRDEGFSSSSSSSAKASEKERRSSASLSASSVLGFLRRNVWKRKAYGEREEKSKKQKLRGIFRVFACKKE